MKIYAFRKDFEFFNIVIFPKFNNLHSFLWDPTGSFCLFPSKNKEKNLKSKKVECYEIIQKFTPFQIGTLLKWTLFKHDITEQKLLSLIHSLRGA